MSVCPLAPANPPSGLVVAAKAQAAVFICIHETDSTVASLALMWLRCSVSRHICTAATVGIALGLRGYTGSRPNLQGKHFEIF